MTQAPDADRLEGLRYEPAFLAPEEEQALIDIISGLPLAAAEYHQYTARRRVVSYGYRYDFERSELLGAQPLPDALRPLRARVAAWAGLEADDIAHVLVSEYAPGTQLGWHRDVPAFERVMGVSLGSAARLRFRPWPHVPKAPGSRARVRVLPVEPRSIYELRGPARWSWQHSVPPVARLRWSITLRTRRPGHDMPADAGPGGAQRGRTSIR